MDKFKIDSHKLMYHLPRVNAWLKGQYIYPIYVEISPSGACNHRCTYCALDYMEYQPRFLDTNLLKNRLSEMAGAGVKSVMFAGEGEPLLHKDIAGIINHTKKAGIDVALTTNGVLLERGLVDCVLGSVTWIKVSINGVSKTTYKKIHRANPGDLDKVMENMSYAARLRKKNGYKCALGMQLVFLPENRREITILARKARGIGMDYLVIKPYSHHPLSKTVKYKNIRYGRNLNLSEKLNALNNNKFNVVFRLNAMKKWDEGVRKYKHCYALHFWAYIDSTGNIWACSAYLGDKRFLCGNIYKNTFKEIWTGSRRKEVLRFAENNLNAKNCRFNCRMDEINRYLWELRNPPEHMNFI